MRDPERTRDTLRQSGLSEVSWDLVQHPMCFGRDEQDAFAFFTEVFGWLLNAVDGAAKDRATADLRRVIAEHRTEAGVLFGSAAWLVTATADPPASVAAVHT